MATKRTTKLPKSKAKNAYDLLSDVRALILAEPLRYNQDIYLHLEKEDGDNAFAAPRGFPACGTVGCVAGWVASIAPRKFDPYISIDRQARDRLGLSDQQAFELFDGRALRHVDARPQTKKYAKAGAVHIARFQKAHAAQLKAHRVTA